MRIDFVNNMKNIYRMERMRNRRLKVFFFLGLAAVAYCGVVLSVTIFKRNDAVISGQEAVAQYEREVTKHAVESSLKTTTAKLPIPAKQPDISVYRSSGKISHSAAPVAATATAPEHAWRSTSNGALTVHTTSSATVKTIGGGSGGFSGGGGGLSVSSPSSAFGVSTSIMVVPTLARASSHNLNASTTMEAEAEVIESTSQGRSAKPGIRNVGGHPLDPFMDPVGDGLLILLFLVSAYAAVMFCRRRLRV